MSCDVCRSSCMATCNYTCTSVCASNCNGTTVSHGSTYTKVNYKKTRIKRIKIFILRLILKILDFFDKHIIK